MLLDALYQTFKNESPAVNYRAWLRIRVGYSHVE